ncbi:MAG: succinate dehydrogenase, cytochrome b556 subunit [Thiotrichales bacterium]|nr:succinate dehydrogenase, cytochrome b556 subunit [Thiotrichales bacterium]
MYQHPGNRPTFINLLKIRFPLNAWLSVSHRISGLALVIALIGYLALINLILLHPEVTLSGIQGHWILLLLHTLFWTALTFHWLSGLRHLLAEHFTATKPYQIINSQGMSQLLLISWGLASVFIIVQVWSL